MIVLKPSRKTGWSSTLRMRIGIGGVIAITHSCSAMVLNSSLKARTSASRSGYKYTTCELKSGHCDQLALLSGLTARASDAPPGDSSGNVPTPGPLSGILTTRSELGRRFPQRRFGPLAADRSIRSRCRGQITPGYQNAAPAKAEPCPCTST
jgi:hypothetical protein